MDVDLVNDAIILYCGRGRSPFPDWDPKRLSDRFGALDAADLVVCIDKLSDEFYLLDPEPSESVGEGADRAARVFAENHPEVSPEAVDALRWTYTYAWK